MRLALSILAALVLIQPPAAEAEPGCLRVASVGEAIEVDLDGALGRTLYREAGLCASVTRIPTERLKRMLAAGDFDAVVARSRDFIRAQPGMVAAPTPLLTLDERLYWPAGRSKPEGAKARIGFPRGWVGPRLQAEKLGVEAVEVNDSGALLKMAQSGRIDGFLMSSYEFDSWVRSQTDRAGFSSISLEVIPLYHAVTAAHADLVPALDAAIQRMVARGEVARLLGLRPPS